VIDESGSAHEVYGWVLLLHVRREQVVCGGGQPVEQAILCEHLGKTLARCERSVKPLCGSTEELALELTTPGFYRVYFRDLEIGELNAEELRFRPARRIV
jgi:hypothetical protein